MKINDKHSISYGIQILAYIIFLVILMYFYESLEVSKASFNESSTHVITMAFGIVMGMITMLVKIIDTIGEFYRACIFE